MIRVGNRTIEVYMSSELNPRNRESVQHSTNNTDKAVRENRDTVEIHDLHAMDIASFMDIQNKFDIMLSKSTHCSIEYLSSYYYQELQREVADYIGNVEHSQGYYGFEDSMASTAHAYSVLHQQIVEGHRNGTRELYVYDSTIGGQRLLTQEEELENLNRAYEELIEWDVGCAKGRYNPERFKERLNKKELDDLYDTYDVNQAGSYIRKSYQEFRSRYLAEYEKSGGKINIKSLFMSALNNENQGIHDFCKVLFGKTKGTSIEPL